MILYLCWNRECTEAQSVVSAVKTLCSVEITLTSHVTNRSFLGRVFPANHVGYGTNKPKINTRNPQNLS